MPSYTNSAPGKRGLLMMRILIVNSFVIPATEDLRLTAARYSLAVGFFPTPAGLVFLLKEFEGGTGVR